MGKVIGIILVAAVVGWVAARFVWLAAKSRKVGLRQAMRDDPYYRAESHVPITQAWALESGRRFVLGKSGSGRLYYKARGKEPPVEGQWLKEHMAKKKQDAVGS